MPHLTARNSADLLEKLYMTVVDDGALKPFLSELALAYDASLATVATMDGQSRHDHLRISSAVDPQQGASTVPGYYAALSPFRPVMLQQRNYGRVMTSGQIVDPERRARDAFINEFLKPDGHEFLVTGIFGQADDRHNYFVLNRGGSHGEFDADAVAGLEDLVPHFRTMLRIRNRMITRDRHIDVVRMSADQRGDGLVLLDRRGKVHSMNAQAEALLEGADGLSLTASMLQAALPEDDGRLQQAIRQLLQSVACGEMEPGVSLAVRRPSGAQAWRLHVIPLALRKFLFAGDEVDLAVQIVGPPATVATIDEAMGEQFGLSRAEIRVATHLIAGVPPKRIADMLGNSINTIKVHRRNLYRKLGVSRHFDLVRLLGGTP